MAVELHRAASCYDSQYRQSQSKRRRWGLATWGREVSSLAVQRCWSSAVTLAPLWVSLTLTETLRGGRSSDEASGNLSLLLVPIFSMPGGDDEQYATTVEMW
ncbi:hypothetical protein SRHO_G00033240 [Serrasalmus rhombeus]